MHLITLYTHTRTYTCVCVCVCVCVVVCVYIYIHIIHTHTHTHKHLGNQILDSRQRSSSVHGRRVAQSPMRRVEHSHGVLCQTQWPVLCTCERVWAQIQSLNLTLNQKLNMAYFARRNVPCCVHVSVSGHRYQARTLN